MDPRAIINLKILAHCHLSMNHYFAFLSDFCNQLIRNQHKVPSKTTHFAKDNPNPINLVLYWKYFTLSVEVSSPVYSWVIVWHQKSIIVHRLHLFRVGSFDPKVLVCFLCCKECEIWVFGLVSFTYCNLEMMLYGDDRSACLACT